MKWRATASFQPRRLIPMQLLWCFKGENHYSLSNPAVPMDSIDSWEQNWRKNWRYHTALLYNSLWGWHAETVSVALPIHYYVFKSLWDLVLISSSLSSSVKQSKRCQSCMFHPSGTAWSCTKTQLRECKVLIQLQTFLKNILLGKENVPSSFQSTSEMQWQTQANMGQPRTAIKEDWQALHINVSKFIITRKQEWNGERCSSPLLQHPEVIFQSCLHLGVQCP